MVPFIFFKCVILKYFSGFYHSTCTEILQLEHHLTFRPLHSKCMPAHFFFLLLISAQLLTFCTRWQSVSISRHGDVLVRLRDPGRVSPYLSRGPDLIKIMRDELFDQDLLTRRRRLQATDKPRPCLPSSSSVVLAAVTLHPSVCHGSFFFSCWEAAKV